MLVTANLIAARVAFGAGAVNVKQHPFETVDTIEVNTGLWPR
jgi:hypothetical protein